MLTLFPSVNADMITKCNDPFQSPVIPDGFYGINLGTINPLIFCVTAQYQWGYLC